MTSKKPGLKKQVDMAMARSSETYYESENGLVMVSIFELSTSIHSQSRMKISDLSKPEKNLESEDSSFSENFCLETIELKNAFIGYPKANSKHRPASTLWTDCSEIAANAYIQNVQLDRLEGKSPCQSYERCIQMQNRECAEGLEELFSQQNFRTSLESKSLTISTESPTKDTSMGCSLCLMAELPTIPLDHNCTSEHREQPHHACRYIYAQAFVTIRLLPLRIHTVTPAKTVVRVGSELFVNGLRIKRPAIFQERQSVDQHEDINPEIIPDFNWLSLESLSCKVLNWFLNKSKSISVYFMEDTSIILQTGNEACPKLQHLEDKWLAKYQINKEIFESTSRGTCIQGDLVYFLDQNCQLRCLDQVELAFAFQEEASCYQATLLGDDKYIDIEYSNSSLYALKSDGIVHMLYFKSKKSGLKKYEIDMSLQKEAYRKQSLSWYTAFSVKKQTLLVAHHDPASRHTTFTFKGGHLHKACNSRSSLLTMPDQNCHVHAVDAIVIKSLMLHAAITIDGVMHLLTRINSKLQIVGRSFNTDLSTKICVVVYLQ